MKYLITIYFLFAIFLISCGMKSPNDYDFFANRILTDEMIISKQINDKNDFQLLTEDSYLQSLQIEKFGDKLYQKFNGDIQRFFIKENKTKIHYWTSNSTNSKKFELKSNYDFGLVIGQSIDKILFYNANSRGRDFGVFNLLSKTFNRIELENLVVINATELDSIPGQYLVSGVRKAKPFNKLGFYKINTDGKIDTIIKEFDLNFSPDGDPSLYNGTFYKYGQFLFFKFDNKSDIYEFNNYGTFVKEFNTIDQFSFKHSSNRTYSPKFDGLYNDILFNDGKLYVRTNIISTKNNYIIFDQYDAKTSAYIKSFKVSVPFMNFRSYGSPTWSFFDDEGLYHILFGNNFSSGRYKEYVVKLDGI